MHLGTRATHTLNLLPAAHTGSTGADRRLVLGERTEIKGTEIASADTLAGKTSHLITELGGSFLSYSVMPDLQCFFFILKVKMPLLWITSYMKEMHFA